jgi:hypothetical protein
LGVVRVCVAVAILVGVAMLSARCAAASDLNPGECITGLKFGQSDFSTLSKLQHFDWMKQYGFNAVEIEAYFMENGLARWQIIEPREGVFNWFALDHHLDDAANAGIKLFFNVSAYGFLPIPRWVWDKYNADI